MSLWSAITDRIAGKDTIIGFGGPMIDRVTVSKHGYQPTEELTGPPPPKPIPSQGQPVTRHWTSKADRMPSSAEQLRPFVTFQLDQDSS